MVEDTPKPAPTREEALAYLSAIFVTLYTMLLDSGQASMQEAEVAVSGAYEALGVLVGVTEDEIRESMKLAQSLFEEIANE